MKNKLIIYLVFFTALMAVFLYFVFRGTDNWKSKSPVLGYVKDFQFVNSNGEAVSNDIMKGKVCVVNFFFTACRGVCPRMNGELMKIYNDYKDNPDFLIISHTCDPERDSVVQLKHYADSLKIDTKKWIFLTGRKDSLYTAAKVSYMLDDPNNKLEKIEDEFLHTQFMALVDKNGKLRSQVFDALKKNEVQMLRDNIDKLLKEKQQNSGLSGGMFSNNPD